MKLRSNLTQIQRCLNFSEFVLFCRLPKQGGSFDSVHIHTPECSHHVHTPSRAGSPSAAECDFHCCALHEEGREIASVATSPIQDGIVAAGGAASTSPSQRRTPNPKGHVRFLDIQQERESSESETENTVSILFAVLHSVYSTPFDLTPCYYFHPLPPSRSWKMKQSHRRNFYCLSISCPLIKSDI